MFFDVGLKCLVLLQSREDHFKLKFNYHFTFDRSHSNHLFVGFGLSESLPHSDLMGNKRGGKEV